MSTRTTDEQVFRELADTYRHELHLHCYRILGSFTDAEDAVQETLLAAWRGLDGFEGCSSLRTWLCRIATNRCLNAQRDAGRRRPPEPVPPFDPPEPSLRGEMTWLQPYPDELLERVADSEPGPEARYGTREAIELAFITGLQLLPPRQAAALVLRDVLCFPADEVASMLGTTETAIKGILQRARASLDKHRDGAAHRPSPQERELTRRFADAFTAADLDGVLSLLTDDAWLAMPPAPHEYHGLAAIAGFLRVTMAIPVERFTVTPTRANNQPAFRCRHGETSAGLMVLTLDGDRIRAITRFLHQK
ncbi:RNA polymerase subunit sigma-70 [Amycolatopsis decaplanina]|uniref:RNA polymerase factor sigma-70 n=1 Tax=Amycolatopsis decaplanina DSM 44594 TaxID=1284240 RepID=M2Z0M3_9PSEU|nr:RNA polymerase subunit sigma-70 [Amycolatopsis decaplanina]EME54114.1 RNA polymerase factor sigma-70 [Amycolatopsis decaplanina DSM 44594]